jgi:hypothetical protein
MGKMGKDYGSEYHLRRYRTGKPTDLDAALLVALGPDAEGGVIEWVYPATTKSPEPSGLAFLRKRDDGRNQKALDAWKTFWPRGRQASWDGIATVTNPNMPPTWLLMEAKANHPEFCSTPCRAGAGLKTIESALGKVKRRWGVHRHFCWTGSYYQFANRLAALYHLERHGIEARLVGIHFIGDCFPDDTPCVASEATWEELLEARRLTLGLPKRMEGVCDVFLAAHAHSQ